jgi:hypothetical protein
MAPVLRLNEPCKRMWVAHGHVPPPRPKPIREIFMSRSTSMTMLYLVVGLEQVEYELWPARHSNLCMPHHFLLTPLRLTAINKQPQQNFGSTRRSQEFSKDSFKNPGQRIGIRMYPHSIQLLIKIRSHVFMYLRSTSQENSLSFAKTAFLYVVYLVM